MQQPHGSADVRFDPLFGLIAESFGWVPSLRFLLRRNRIVKILQRIQYNSFLEIGCGSGSLLVEISKKYSLYTHGLETSETARILANKIIDSTAAKVQIHATPADNWNEQYDVICAFEVLEHIEHDLNALSDWYRWVKPGGTMLISVPAHQKRWGHGDIWAGHYRRYDLNNLKTLVTNAGLAIEHIECYGFPLANLTEKLGDNVYKSKIETQLNPTDKDTATAGSGVKRDSYLKLFRWIDNPLGRISLYAAFVIQRLFYKTRLGSGYIVLAKKPCDC